MDDRRSFLKKLGIGIAATSVAFNSKAAKEKVESPCPPPPAGGSYVDNGGLDITPASVDTNWLVGDYCHRGGSVYRLLNSRDKLRKGDVVYWCEPGRLNHYSVTTLPNGKLAGFAACDSNGGITWIKLDGRLFLRDV